MKTLWIVTVVAVIAIAGSCGALGDAAPGPITPDADTAEDAMKKFFEAIKRGDLDTAISYFDLKGEYDKMSDEQRKAMGATDYEAFVRRIRAIMEAGKEQGAKMEYEVLGSEVKGDVTIVKVKLKNYGTPEWQEMEWHFKKIDGKWKTGLDQP